MSQINQISPRLLRMLILIGLSVLLSACAGRQRPLEPARPYNVTEVEVTAQNAQDLGFAGRLQHRLEASVGRMTSDIGETAALKIVVLDHRMEPSPMSLFGAAFKSASLNMTLIDPDTGQVLRARALRAASSDFSGRNVEALLVSRLTNDIRGVLGLSGYTPYPVGGAKRDVVWPKNRPDLDGELTDATLLSADPLLNGTVTPSTLNYDAEPATVPAMDISKPLLDATPAVEPSTPTDTMASPALVKVPQSLEYPAEQPDVATVSEDAGLLDEPCIITLDNDCSDPDSR